MLATDSTYSDVIYPRVERNVLSFRGESLLRGRHLIHPYPAMLHPLLVDHLIDTFAEKGDKIFDPFCGSGVTCLQASVKGYASIGFDINPLALLIAKVKTDTYDEGHLLEELATLKRDIKACTMMDVPVMKNIYYWYTKDVIDDLGKIRHVLRNGSYRYKNFFLAAFAYISRNQSLTKNGEFKRYRVANHLIGQMANEVLPKFFMHLEKMITVFSVAKTPKAKSDIRLANTENTANFNASYDLVITSPPYGDSRTTVAYGQYTSFGIDWTKAINPYCDGKSGYALDNHGLGEASKLNDLLWKHGGPLQDVIYRIKLVDAKRAMQVQHFFNGYYNAIRNIVEKLNYGGKLCFVVGNRTVKGFQIPMDQITASFLESMGMQFRYIFVRGISAKVMPSRNSPSNVAGVTSNTMSKEYIVLFEKGELS